ncbi:MAG: hypothetical protein ACTS3F_02625 [Phycisphaerales bacterium]
MKLRPLGAEQDGMNRRRAVIPIVPLVVLAFALVGCGMSTPRDPDRPYHGRDRCSPSPAQHRAELYFAERLDARENEGR